ncbi:hypothetical protein FQZ97_770750 [compost metagenome]
MYHKAGDIQLVALHVEVRCRHPRMGFHLTDEMRPRLRRQAHVMGETTQRPEDAAGGGNAHQRPGTQAHLAGQQRAGAAHGVTDHRMQRWQLAASLQQGTGEEHHVGFMSRRTAVGRTIQRHHAVAGTDQGLDQAGELGRPPFPTVHQQHRGATAPAQGGQAEAQGDALGAAEQRHLPVPRRQVARRHELPAHAAGDGLRRQTAEGGMESANQAQVVHRSAPQITADLAARSTRSDRSHGPNARARASPPTIRARSASALSASSGLSLISALISSRCSARMVR